MWINPIMSENNSLIMISRAKKHGVAKNKIKNMTINHLIDVSIIISFSKKYVFISLL
jgi:hypothetical protein